MRNKIILVYGLFLLVFFGGMIGYTHYGMQRAETIYFRIRPVDPRALLMGDYMALSYDVERDMREPFTLYVSSENVLQTQPTEGARQITIPVQKRSAMITHGRPRVLRVPHQFYFEEGQGKRFEGAVYAKMRRLPDGRFLLETLTDENFRPL